MVGEIKLLAFSGSVPSGYEPCDGRAVLRTLTDLFALIGTQYGAGDGASTFNLPDISATPLGQYVIQTIPLNEGGSGSEQILRVKFSFES